MTVPSATYGKNWHELAKSLLMLGLSVAGGTTAAAATRAARVKLTHSCPSLVLQIGGQGLQ